jgi:hypothetical protein
MERRGRSLRRKRCCNQLPGRKRPDIVLWVVTRIPEWAAKIEDLPNVFIHFSLTGPPSLDKSNFFEALLDLASTSSPISASLRGARN